jgi:hypothetical protein
MMRKPISKIHDKDRRSRIIVIHTCKYAGAKWDI